MRVWGVWLAALVVTLTAVAAPAEPTGRALPGRDEPLPIDDGVLSLSLEEAVRLSIERNLDVQLLRFDPVVAEEELDIAWGAYDPELYGQGGYVNQETPTASELFGNLILSQETWSGESGVRGLIPWVGGSYDVSYAGDQIETNSRISVLSPQFDSSFSATVQLPLLRDLFWSPAWTVVRTGRVLVDASRAQFASNLMDLVELTENAYWALIASQDSTRVAQKSLETAQALIEQTQAQYEVGVVSRVEVVQAEAGVADREFNLIRAQAVERNSQDALVDAVLGPYLEPETALQVVLTDRPEELTILQVSTTAATERAMARRPDLQVARKEIERREIEVKATGNQRLPRLDVVGSYGQAGLAGRTNPDCIDFTAGVPCADPPGIKTRWIDSNDAFFGAESGKNYSVLGVLSIPLGNNAARHDHQRAAFELRRATTGLTRLEQTVISEIRRSARNLGSAVEGIEAAERGVTAAEEQLRAERVRLEHGESTPFDVLQREEDLVRAQSQKILAQQAYHDSVSALDRAQGTILERHQIVVDQAATLR